MMLSPTELRRGTTADSVTIQNVTPDTPDMVLRTLARDYLRDRTGYESRDLGASINRYPVSASAVVILWKD